MIRPGSSLVTLLFVTQKLHEQDAFVVLWVRAFMRRGYTVKVLCLENRTNIADFEIYSMGKEKGYGKVRQALRFWKFILTLKYDRVFVHMAPIYGLLGSPWWILRCMPTYLWYTHYKCSVPVRVTQFYAERIFCATPQSVPWLSGSDQKVVVGHGIDLDFWQKRENRTSNPKELLVVHRLSRSKRVEMSLRALTILPEEYTMVIYGIEAEPDYVSELHALVEELGLQSRVNFKGTTPMDTLPEIYSSHQLILNMASETIDKTMLEAMTCGCYPVTTQGNAEAIGISEAPVDDSPEAVADFIQNFSGVGPEKLFSVVKDRHSLSGLIEKMDQYIATGK